MTEIGIFKIIWRLLLLRGDSGLRRKIWRICRHLSAHVADSQNTFGVVMLWWWPLIWTYHVEFEFGSSTELEVFTKKLDDSNSMSAKSGWSTYTSGDKIMMPCTLIPQHNRTLHCRHRTCWPSEISMTQRVNQRVRWDDQPDIAWIGYIKQARNSKALSQANPAKSRTSQKAI